MRIAVLSDIHGNLPALEAVLAELKPFDLLWQLGDVVGYGPQPDEVVARLMEENALGVRGNHDSAAIGTLATDAFNDDARFAVEWTADRIRPETRAWLAALPMRSIDDPFTLVHGSPRDPTWEYVYSIGIARANLDAFDTRHCLLGHTHVPLVFRASADERGRLQAVQPAADSSLTLDGQRLIVNPGSVGQPRDGDPRASAMLIDTERSVIEWRRIEYAVDDVQKRMSEVRLPARLIARLRFGL